MWLRIGLVPLFVVACHLFDWHAWRAFNTSAFLAVAQALGIPSARVTFDTFFTLGQAYRFETACTAIDAYFGSIPLLWERNRSIAWNGGFFAAYFGVLFAANMIRLAFGMWIFVRGVPWWLSHEAFSGVCYFVMFLWIARRRGWSFGVLPHTLAQAR